MNMDSLLDFLNPAQQRSLEGYSLLENRKEIKKGDYVKFMLKENYKLMDGGIVIDMDEWPVLRLKSYEKSFNNFYKVDASRVYLFWKRKNKLTRRDFFEDLLENLEKGKLKKSK